MRALLRRFARQRRGAVTVVVAFAIPALIIAGGVMTDLGWIYLRGRQLQGMADLAAMSAVQDLANGPRASPAPAPPPPRRRRDRGRERLA